MGRLSPQFNVVSKKVLKNYVGFVENCRAQIRGEKRVKLREAIERALEANLPLAEESIAAMQAVIRAPISVCS